MRNFDPSANHDAFRPTPAQVNEFIQEQVLGVLSTLDSEGAPMGATVALSTTLDGNILVGTSESSHKSQNIDGDSRVAITVTDPERRYTLQLQGTARKLGQQAFEAMYAEEHFRQRPQSLPFKDEPGQCHILIAPTHIRFSDCSVNPWVVTEFEGEHEAV